jgi:hypothetical protein
MMASREALGAAKCAPCDRLFAVWAALVAADGPSALRAHHDVGQEPDRRAGDRVAVRPQRFICWGKKVAICGKA